MMFVCLRAHAWGPAHMTPGASTHDTVSWERNTKGVTAVNARSPGIGRWDCEWLRAEVQEFDTWVQILFHLFAV